MIGFECITGKITLEFIAIFYSRIIKNKKEQCGTRASYANSRV